MEPLNPFKHEKYPKDEIYVESESEVIEANVEVTKIGLRSRFGSRISRGNVDFTLLSLVCCVAIGSSASSIASDWLVAITTIAVVMILAFSFLDQNGKSHGTSKKIRDGPPELSSQSKSKGSDRKS